MYLVHQRIGSLKTSGRRHPVINHMAGKSRQFRFIIKPGDFHKTETMIDKTGLPTEIAVFGWRINICHQRFTQVCQVERTVFLQQFGKRHGDGLIFFPFQVYGQPADHILSHIQDIFAVGTFKDGNRFQGFLYPDIRILLCSQLSGRSFHYVGSFPGAIVITIRVPACHF